MINRFPGNERLPIRISSHRYNYFLSRAIYAILRATRWYSM